MVPNGGSQNRMDAVEKREIHAPPGNRTPVIQYVPSHLSNLAIQAHYFQNCKPSAVIHTSKHHSMPTTCQKE
jgi:hypothetical protein